MSPTRRELLIGAAALGATPALPALAQEGERESHGLSAFGDLKYPADFPHFEYVNPRAPKGGSASYTISSGTGNQSFQTFNTLNIYVLKGDGAAGMGLTFDSLMAASLDEPDSLYGLVAKSVRISPDGRVYRFRLRPEARFHDGSRITARDVVFSLETLKTKGHPAYVQLLRPLESVTAEGDDVVTVRFVEKRGRDAPLVVAGMPIFSAAYYATRPFEESTLEAPLGSGPYRVKRVEVGRFITFERVPDFWAKDLPVMVGLNNFDEVRYEYFRDREAGYQAFTSGAYTIREEFTSRVWKTRYDFPALREGKVIREELADETPSGAQGWFINMRREKFADPRVREALIQCFDFEWTNANIMFSVMRRTQSMFENSPLKASGPPSPEELRLLEPFRASLDPEVFGEPVTPPVSDGSGQDRRLLRRAGELLAQAGFKRDAGGVMRQPNGQPFTIEFLEDDGSLQPHTNPFIKNLRLLGIDASIRMVDPAQYQRRVEEFDFDLTVRRYSFGLAPGEAIRNNMGSAAAKTRGSSNLAGISHPAVDALVEAVIQAKTREEVTIAARALDRVLRAQRFWVPQWFRAENWIAYWDQYARPEILPKYGRAAFSAWWYDPEKAKRIGRT
ncbi:extracellular solute-binding protein [Salinarimonas soli]|uniref:ABC transporter substrate-binding protein n=1 Tax=Salinarimonas soli TaxID=1638099 RepID=A0A5B2VD97_9HYPH|nr:extracellular solute-binding protein [Salinarimonas soli]KAA2236382.1 ABC transporter substrate-binding protein [Salinarimonas soli]